MKILFLMDPARAIQIKTDTTFVLMLASQERNHEIWMAEPGRLFVEQGEAAVAARRVSVTRQTKWCRILNESSIPLSSFDLIWMRKDPPYNLNYIFATHLLDLVSEKVMIVNHPAGLRDTNEKLSILHFPQLIPRTLITSDVTQVVSFLRENGGKAVVKPLDRAGGEGLFFLNFEDRNLKHIVAEMTEEGNRPVLVQEFLSEVIEKGDKRLLVLDGEPIGALTRLPKEGEWRANLHRGGRGVPASIDAIDRQICEKIGPYLREKGLYFVGLDIIGGKLTEINVTSPTCVQEINQLNGVRLEEKIVAWSETAVAAFSHSH
ncbi:MAG: glutathione synthase [Deltaproteobacteria bacterium]|nr:glutathione synthase [Deltaproteobacteria bacterium]